MKRLEWLQSQLGRQAWEEIEARELARHMLADPECFDEAWHTRAIENAATSEVRRLLKTRDTEGVPFFANMLRAAGSGETIHRYKQVEFFTADDFVAMVDYHQRRAKTEVGMARRFAQRGIQIHGSAVASQLRWTDITTEAARAPVMRA